MLSGDFKMSHRKPLDRTLGRWMPVIPAATAHFTDNRQPGMH